MDKKTLIGFDNKALPRRSLLLGGLSAAAGLCAPSVLRAGAGFSNTLCVPTGGGYGSGDVYDDLFDEDFLDSVPEDGPGERRVWMVNPRNGEKFEEVYVKDGQYNKEALEKYNWFARDWRHDDPRNMDPGLLDIVWKLTKMLDVEGEHWRLNSGYRNPASNATVGGAKNSYHMRGMANDIVHPSRSPRAVYAAAMRIANGGVGRYSSFTHIDTGPHRTWG